MQMKSNTVQQFIAKSSSALKRHPHSYEFNSDAQLDNWKVELCDEVILEYGLPGDARDRFIRAAKAASRKKPNQFEFCFSGYCEDLIGSVESGQLNAESGYGDGHCEM